MKNFDFKKILPHLSILIIFVIISYAYFAPVLEGKVLQQGDFTHAKGAAQELVDYKAKTGLDAQWTNSMFSGMPAYQIKGGTQQNIYYYINNFLRFGLPYTTVAIVFLYLLGFYILLLTLKFNQWLSLIGAIAFAFSTYNFIIIGAGHITKTYAIAYMPLVLAGVMLTFNKKYLVGGLLTTFALGMEIAANHIQMTYYLMLIIFVMAIVKLIYAFIEKEIKKFLLASSILLVAVILAFLPNITNLWTTYEYGKYTIRGESDLKQAETTKQSNGLDPNYAYGWSYGKAETFTLLIPNFMGSSSNEDLSVNSALYEAASNAKSQNDEFLQKYNLEPQDIIENAPTYWGEMPFTSGPAYAGAIICFLFVLGLFIVKGPEKWWLLGATILSILLSWGSNLQWFSDFFFYHFPFYNKFRTVSSILVIAGLTMPLLAFLALNEFLKKEIDKTKLIKPVIYSVAIVGGLAFLFFAIPNAFFKFTTSNDSQYMAYGYPNWFFNALYIDRASMLRWDAFRTLILILLAVGTIWLFIKNKIKITVFIALFALLIIFDMWGVAKRYLNSDSFVKKSYAKNEFVESPADEAILKDQNLNYRVLNLNNPFNEVNTSYFHKSIGGYHGAKLKRYQELVDSCITNDIRKITNVFSSKPTDSLFDIAFKNCRTLNMLNAKYIIYNPSAPPLLNTHAYGNAWFVNEYKLVDDANSEITTTKRVSPWQTAVIDKKFANLVEKYKNNRDTLASIKLIDYKPDYLTYQSTTQKEQLAVFSEIYYDKGWNAYIDGNSVPYFRADYVLRAMLIPAGEHKIEFKFEPKSYYKGQKIALYSSILVILLLLGTLGYGIYKKNKLKTPIA